MTGRPEERVPFADLALQHRNMAGEIDQAIERVMLASSFILGDEGRGFEASFAAYCDSAFAVGCGNGTDALEMALNAVGVGVGDEVITVAHTFVATVEAIVRCGAIPRFVDINRGDLLIDGSAVESAIGPRTKAIVAVHLYGSCADMESLMAIGRAHGLSVIEDAAQAHGSRLHARRAGSLGDIATFSFYPGKNLGALGDAGAIVTSDEGLAERVRMMRDHGRKEKYESEFFGRNSRIDGIQAAVLRAKLKHLDTWNQRRQAIAHAYDAEFASLSGSIELVRPGSGCESVYHLYVVRVHGRERWRNELNELGIETGLHYPLPVHKQEAFRRFTVSAPLALPITEAAAASVLSLPMFAEMTDDQVQRVIDTVKAVAARIG